MTTPVIEVTIAAPAKDLWPALRDPELIAQWHGWETEGTALADEIDLIYLQGVEVVEEGRSFTLSGGDTFELTAVDGATQLRITRAPYDPNWEWAAYYHDITEGWHTFAQQLRFWFERHPGETRRTLYYAGEAAPSITDLPSPGTESWFETELQYGVVLDDQGPGLLILARNPAPGSTSSSAVVTTYGLSEDHLAATKAAWDSWWAGSQQN